MAVEEKFAEASKALECNRLDEARSRFEEILAEKPDYIPAINKMGVLCIQADQPETAKAYFNRALSVNPDYAPALVNLGNLRSAAGDTAAAMALYQLAVEKDEDYYLSYYNMAVLHKQAGRFDEYMRCIRQYKRCYKKYVSERKAIYKDKAKRGFYAPIVIIPFVIGVTFIFIFFINK